MLKKLLTLIASHVHALKNSLVFFKRKPFATLMTVVVIGITLALPTLFWVFTHNLEQLTLSWQRGGHISLYLVTPLSSADEADLLAHVRATTGVEFALLKSSDEGLAELQQQEGMQDIMHYLPENPLPAVIDVTPLPAINTPAKLKQLYQQLKSYHHVEQAKLDMQWINRLYTILGVVAKLTHGLMLLLAFAVALIIGNTLRLAIHTRHEEIQVLKLIGATDPFIIRPFLYSGVWYGLTGAVLAVFLVDLFILSLTFVVNQLAEAYQIHSPLLGLSISQAFILVLSAMLLGWLGARLSIKRQLASIEPGS